MKTKFRKSFPFFEYKCRFERTELNIQRSILWKYFDVSLITKYSIISNNHIQSFSLNINSHIFWKMDKKKKKKFSFTIELFSRTRDIWNFSHYKKISKSKKEFCNNSIFFSFKMTIIFYKFHIIKFNFKKRKNLHLVQ